MISGSREVLIWDFCAAVLGRDAKTALAQLAALLGQDESEIGILILLAGQVRMAALAAVLRENRLLQVKGGPYASAVVAPEGAAYLPRKKSGEPISPYLLGQAAQRSQGRPASFWFAALGTLYRAQREMLTGASDKRRALELAVLEIVTDSPKARSPKLPQL
ncbi:MAG: hypothetical protein WDO13_07685 [Verrucomicrobiota bacterium]